MAEEVIYSAMHPLCLTTIKVKVSKISDKIFSVEVSNVGKDVIGRFILPSFYIPIYVHSDEFSFESFYELFKDIDMMVGDYKVLTYPEYPEELEEMLHEPIKKFENKTLKELLELENKLQRYVINYLDELEKKNIDFKLDLRGLDYETVGEITYTLESSKNKEFIVKVVDDYHVIYDVEGYEYVSYTILTDKEGIIKLLDILEKKNISINRLRAIREQAKEFLKSELKRRKIEKITKAKI